MKRTLAWLCLSLLLAMPVQNCLADDEPTTRPVGIGSFINSDCEWPLVSRPAGRCHAECVEDRDCGSGSVCELISGKPYGMCKPASPPPAPGGFTGRVERALGEGVPCSIAIFPVSGGSSAGMVSCDPKSGGFMKEGLKPGIYVLSVTAGISPLISTRDFYAPVNAGQTTDLGALTVIVDAMIVNPSRPAFPGMDIRRDTMPLPGGMSPNQQPLR